MVLGFDEHLKSEQEKPLQLALRKLLVFPEASQILAQPFAGEDPFGWVFPEEEELLKVNVVVGNIGEDVAQEISLLVLLELVDEVQNV